MIQNLSGNESQGYVRGYRARDRGAKNLSEEEAKANAAAPTGACCIYTYGASSRPDRITETACRTAAQNTQTKYKWWEDNGKSSTEVFWLAVS